MRRMLIMCVAVALAALPATAQETSVLKRTPQLAAPIAGSVAADLLQAETLPSPAMLPPGAEVIPTPAPTLAPPTLAPVPWVWEPRTYAVPTVHWGLFGKRLVPKTVYVRQYHLRPAQVEGPFYLLR